jgi:PAS domain S-box-containing protein
MTFVQLKNFHWPRARESLLHCRWLLVLLAMSIFASLSGLSASEGPPPPQVIILNSYHPGFTWSDGELTGVLQELRRVYPDLDPAIEYLDTKHFPFDEHLLKVKDYLARKYHGHKFDLVIVLDNSALEMVMAHRPELFPETPVVFSGINDFKPAMLAGNKKKVTGVAENLNIEGTLKMALALHPGTTEIFVVTDYTITGKSTKKEIEAVVPNLPAGVHVEFAPPATMAELVDHIKRLPAAAVIFIAGFATDKAGQSFSMAEGAHRLTQEAKIPAYIVHEGRLGYGPVGGMLLDGREEGRQAGKIALRILAGTDPASIPVEMKSPTRPMFDSRQLARFKIPESALPAGSIIINRPSSFYQVHKPLVWGTAGVILALGLVITLMSLSITRRRRTEAALRESEEGFRALVENISLGITLIDPDYRIAMTNPAQGKLFQKPVSELIGQECFWAFEKRESVCPHCPGTIAMATGKKAEVEAKGFLDNGNVITSRVQAFPRFGPDGQITGFIELIEEITQKKQLELERKQYVDFLQNLLDTMPNLVFYKDATGVYKGCNQAMEEFLGLSKEEIIGKTVFALYPKDLAEKYEAMDQKLFHHRGIQVYESDVERSDGARRRFIFNKATFLGREGELGGLIGVMTDITERNQAEEALRKSEEKFRLVFEKAPIGIMHYDQTSTITDCNAKFAEIIGSPKGAFIGFNMIRQLRDEQMREAVVASLKGEVGYYEGDYLSVTGGNLAPVRGIYQPIFSLEGEISGGITLFEDISERKKAEAERLRFSKLESMGTLAGGIAHDFNNILTAILGNLSLAKLNLQNQEYTNKRLNDTERACQKAQMLAQQLLTFAKGGAPVKELVSLENLVTETGSFACRGSKTQCTFNFSDNLWAIEADPGQINQVIQNLIINAIQAMPTGGTIQVQSENLMVEATSDLPLSPGKYVKISIQDQGVGIPGDHLANIFDPYFTTKQTGSGLGLATVHAIVQRHQGYIAVKSTIGAGTTFDIYLPAVDREIAASPDKERELLSGQGTILVMDDEEMVRQTIGRMLAYLGYQVAFAKDGAEAVELFTQARESGTTFAAVILDLTISGGMGGEETMERLLEIDPQVRAIVSSGYSDAPIIAEFQKYGFSGVIAKPFTISVLSEVIAGIKCKERS